MDTAYQENIVQLHAGLCAAIADSKRIQLLYAIATEPTNVSTLAENVGISQPVASRHLKILRDAGLIYPERTKTGVVYHITDQRLLVAMDLLRTVLNDRLVREARLVR